MDEINIPIDIYNELPFYAARAASSGADGAKQQWAVIGALARTCRAAADAVRKHKAALIQASLRFVIGKAPNGDVFSRQHVLPNGGYHGVQRETVYRSAAGNHENIRLFEFGRCLRHAYISSSLHGLTTMNISIANYFRVGEALRIWVMVYSPNDPLYAPGDNWIAVHPDDTKLFVRESAKLLKRPALCVEISATTSPEDHSLISGMLEDYGSYVRLCEARDFIQAALDARWASADAELKPSRPEIVGMRHGYMAR